MSLAWGQAAETRTLLIWPCVEKPSHHKHLMLQVLCWSSEAYWNSWKNCRWRRWVTDEAGETYAVLDVCSSPAGSKPARCGCKWNIVPTPRSLYKESFSTWQQTGDDDWVLIFFFFLKNVQQGLAEPAAEILWWRLLFSVWSWAGMNSEPSLVNCSDGRALLPRSLMVRQIHCWREDSHGVLKMPWRSHRPYKYFIRTLEKFFFSFMWNRRTQRVLN